MMKHELSRKNIEIKYHLTTDKILLDQYHQLLNQSFNSDKYMMGHFNGGFPDYYDGCSDVVLATTNNIVVGGIRLTTSSPKKRILLPTEQTGIDFGKIINTNLNEYTYGEIHRFVVAKEYRHLNIAENLIISILPIINKLEWDFLFTPSLLIKARLYRLLCKKIGIDLKIVEGVTICVEKYNNVPMVLLMGKAKKKT